MGLNFEAQYQIKPNPGHSKIGIGVLVIGYRQKARKRELPKYVMPKSNDLR